MSLLEVKNLCRVFAGQVALDRVSFTLEPGVIMGFVGPNGAGKTTSLRIIATLDVPTSGEVFIDGEPAHVAPARVRPWLGYMPDRYGVYEDISVREMLDFYARAHGLHAQERHARVDTVLEFGRLTEHAGTLTRALSKGMRQRLALARTLLHDPRLLLLDEPADGLDPQGRIELRELLKALAEQGKAVLISSHILSDLADMCQACAFIDKGRLVAVDAIDTLVARVAGLSAPVVVIRLVKGSSEETHRAQRLISEQPQVHSVDIDGAQLRVTLAPGVAPAAGWVETCCARLLTVLVQSGVAVAGLESTAPDLEEVFLRLNPGSAA